MGFVFARVMRFYSLSCDDTMNLPLRRFWFLANQIDRLRAEESLETIMLLGSVQNGKAFDKAIESLTTKVGQIYVWKPVEKTIVLPAEQRVDPVTGLDPEFDRSALQALRARHCSG